jgi:hypothetical protein
MTILRGDIWFASLDPRSMREPVSQGVVDARLPTVAGAPERFDHVGVQADIEVLFRFLSRLALRRLIT